MIVSPAHTCIPSLAIPMSTVFPDRSALVSAVMATCSVALASTLVFHPFVRVHVLPGQGVLAPTWALVLCSLHAGTVFADGIRSMIGALVGGAFGIAAYAIAEQIPVDVTSRHVIASVLAIPFAFIICLADPVLASPISAWMKSDVALLTLYIVASFSKLNGYVACQNAIIAFAFGSACAMVIAGLTRALTDLGSTQRRLADSIHRFSSAQTHWLEGLAAFMAAASGDHSTELDLRQEAAGKALTAMQQSLSLAKVSDPWSVLQQPDAALDLSVTAVLMHSQLLAFRGTILQESYREDTSRVVFSPISDSFNRTRMCVVLALRPSTPAKVRENAHLALKEEANQLYKALINNAAITASTRHSDLPHGSEVVRFHFAVVALIRFTLLVDRFLDAVGPATRLHGPYTSMGVYWKDKWRGLLSRTSWRKTANISHAVRSVIAQQLICQIALVVARVDPTGFGPYILWCQLPVVFCFLHTFGGSVIKGSRRVLGTLAGGAIGCVSALVNAGSESSFWLEMIIVAFVGKLLSFHPSVGYAGVVFSFTWFICMLASITVTDTSLLLTAVFYRMVLTVGGVIASYLFGALLFPSFSASGMRSSMSQAIITSTAIVVDSIRGVVAGTPFDQPAENSLTEFKGAGDKAVKSLHKHIASLATLCVESKAEVKFIKNFMLVKNRRTPTVERLVASEEVLYRFIDSVLVLSATAAGTRISRYSHSLFFTDEVVLALNQFADKAALAGAKLEAIVRGEPFVVDECYTGDRLDAVDRNLMAVRRSLGHARKLPEAVKGGSPLIYVFHFALCEMADRWDDLVRALDGVADRGDKPERFRRESSSVINIC